MTHATVQVPGVYLENLCLKSYIEGLHIHGTYEKEAILAKNGDKYQVQVGYLRYISVGTKPFI